MAQIHDIKRRINSTAGTRKITQAMQRLAFVKMGAAKRRAEALRPYRAHLLRIMGRLRRVNQDEVPAMLARHGRTARVGLIVVSTDKGLCGALNLRLLQLCLAQMRSWQQAGRTTTVTVIGRRGLGTLRRAGANIVSQAIDVGDSLDVVQEDLIGAIAVPLQQYLAGEIDQLYVAANRFINTLNYEPTLLRLLPIGKDIEPAPEAPPAGASDPGVDYVYEPDAGAVINMLMMRYVEALIYAAIAENTACEHCARMTAMKTATDNASRLIDELPLEYNQQRQNAITQELIEITAGADAVR